MFENCHSDHGFGVRNADSVINHHIPVELLILQLLFWYNRYSKAITWHIGFNFSQIDYILACWRNLKHVSNIDIINIELLAFKQKLIALDVCMSILIDLNL